MVKGHIKKPMVYYHEATGTFCRTEREYDILEAEWQETSLRQKQKEEKAQKVRQQISEKQKELIEYRRRGRALRPIIKKAIKEETNHITVQLDEVKTQLLKLKEKQKILKASLSSHEDEIIDKILKKENYNPTKEETLLNDLQLLKHKLWRI